MRSLALGEEFLRLGFGVREDHLLDGVHDHLGAVALADSLDTEVFHNLVGIASESFQDLRAKSWFVVLLGAVVLRQGPELPLVVVSGASGEDEDPGTGLALLTIPALVLALALWLYIRATHG